MLGYDDYIFLTSKEWRDALAKKNKDTIKRGQEILGFTGNDVDGIAGNATRNAYNTQMLEADKYYAPTKKAQYIPNENADKLYQDFNDAQVYGFNQDEAVNELNQEIYNEQVAKLESQIAQVEERIARNKRALTGKSYEDVNNKLAQLEMNKIGFRFNRQPTNNDPTSFWRWNQARQDTKEAYNKQNQNTLNKWANSANAVLKQDINPYNFEDMRYQLKTVREMIANGQTFGATDSQLAPLFAREKELDEKVKDEYRNADNKKKTMTKMAELDKRLANRTIKPAEYNLEIQKLLDEAGTDLELIETLKTKLQYGKKKATPSSVPQV